MRKILSQSFRRHTTKNKDGNATKYGYKEAKKLGKELPIGTVLKSYVSNIKEDRCFKTLEAMEKGFKSTMGVVATGKQPIRGTLGELKILKNKLKVYELLKKIGTENKFLEKWYSNKIPKSIMLKPNEVADIIIKDRLAHVIRFINLKSKGYSGKLEDLPKIHLENITHDFIVGALFQRLTGKKLKDYNVNLKIKARENINLDYYKSKAGIRVFLTFRKNKFDVTKKLNEILKN